LSQVRQPQTNDLGNGEKSSIAKLFEQGSSGVYLFYLYFFQFGPHGKLMELLSYCSFLTKSNFSSVGLQRILSLLEAEDVDVRIHAVKVVANLAAEGFFLVLYQHLLQLLFMGSANLFRIVLVLIYSPVGCHRRSDF